MAQKDNPPRITVSLTVEQRDLLKKAANTAGLPLSAYLRMAALERAAFLRRENGTQ
jgi:uncharacterized protein (DUF1778 family)